MSSTYLKLTFCISFANSGTMLIFRLESGQISITITAASSLINKTEGLLGVFDQNKDNDLKARDGPTLSVNSSAEVIFGDFGHSCKELTYNPKQKPDYHSYIDYVYFRATRRL